MAKSKSRSIEKVVRIAQLGEPNKDADFWRALPYSDRLAALEEIRREYNHWKYNAQPGFQRVYSIVKQ